jgi:Domain of unknown function (DUF4386)
MPNLRADSPAEMPPSTRSARVAGAIYSLLAITGPFTLIYIPGKFIVPGNAAASVSTILAHEMLFRIGILAELACAVTWIAVVMALYRLLGGVSRIHALLMVAFVLVANAIACLNAVNNAAALILARGPAYLAVFDKPQRDALAMFFLRLHGQGDTVTQVFAGLWLLPFGLLVIRSGFLPRILGVLLVVNGLAYIVTSLTSLLWPAQGAVVFNWLFPALLGELWIVLWLLVKGVRPQQSALLPIPEVP